MHPNLAAGSLHQKGDQECGEAQSKGEAKEARMVYPRGHGHDTEVEQDLRLISKHFKMSFPDVKQTCLQQGKRLHVVNSWSTMPHKEVCSRRRQVLPEEGQRTPCEDAWLKFVCIA